MKTEVIVLEPQLVAVEKIHVVGISTRTSNSRELNARSAKIPVLWQRFHHDHISYEIPNTKNEDILYAVYTDYRNHYEGDYSVVAGMETDVKNCPNGLVRATVQAGRYLAFRSQGFDAVAVQETWRSIWKFFEHHKEYHRAYTTDFERYNHAEGVVDIYIALQ